LYKGDESEFQEPLGIERLAGFLEMRGVAVRQFDRRLFAREHSPAFWQEFEEAFPTGHSPNLVGLSVMTAEDVPDALRVISRISARHPLARFIAGGLYVTTNPEAARTRFPPPVQLVAYEGELPLLEAVLKQELPAASITPSPDTPSSPAVLHRDGCCPSTVGTENGGPHAGDHTLTPNEWAPASRPNFERYVRLGCAISLQSTRGCQGSCSFCATPELPLPYRCWRGRAIALVANEVEALTARARAAGLLPIFNFVDDDFGSLGRIEELSAELQRRDLHIAYALQLRVGALLGQERLAERLAALNRGGFTRVFLGVESLCAKTLKNWNKPYPTNGLPAVFNALRLAGISAHIGYILWHSSSTVEGAREEARRLWEMGLYCPKVAESRMVLFPGSRLHRQSQASGLHSHNARWEPLEPEVEGFYHSLSNRLRPLYDVWKEGAVLAPWLAAQAHLTNNPTALHELNSILTQCDRYSYQGLVNSVFPKDLPEIASELMSRVRRIQSAVLA
jgi:radical SAM superfamily enzyme YgiQ (UPF0313 family)